MARDSRRSIHSYGHQGGNLNEFEFQKSQRELAEESKPQFPVDTGNPNVSQPERVAEVMAEAHKIVEKRRKHGAAPQVRQGAAAGKGPAKPAKKAPKKSAKKTAKSAGPKKRASVKTRGQRLATSR